MGRKLRVLKQQITKDDFEEQKIEEVENDKYIVIRKVGKVGRPKSDEFDNIKDEIIELAEKGIAIATIAKIFAIKEFWRLRRYCKSNNIKKIKKGE